MISLTFASILFVSWTFMSQYMYTVFLLDVLFFILKTSKLGYSSGWGKRLSMYNMGFVAQLYFVCCPVIVECK